MIDAFPDRRNQFFGRVADVQALTDRARRVGLTVVVGRPLMGKTWTLTEVARILNEEGCLVGYHESKGAENSHLLYAVSNLYARWLSDSSMREQAISLWARHKDALVPKVGQILGTLFEKLSLVQWPSGVASVVRTTFDGLVEVQKDLLSGGLQIAPLSYEQALSLTELVSTISKRRVVLILDAWEKSPALRFEFTTLEAFLKHQDDWRDAHIFLAVRNLDIDSVKLNDEAFRRASDLCLISNTAHLYEIGPLNQSDSKERQRIINYFRTEIPAAHAVTEESLFAMIDGYPGVIDFWINDAARKAIAKPSDLQNAARNAQNLRYLELEHMLSALTSDVERTLAARIALFPRLDVDTWTFFKDILLGQHSELDLEALIDCEVLHDEHYPTFGHDTRHAAARHWFFTKRRALFRRVTEAIIEATASRITGLESSDQPLIEVLIAISSIAEELGTSPRTLCLVHAALTVEGDFDPISYPAFDSLAADVCARNPKVVPIISIAYSNRGISKVHQGNYEGAVNDFSALITLPNVPASRIAYALFNRGYAKGLKGDIEEEVVDYSSALSLNGAPLDVRARALVNRGRANSKKGSADKAFEDYSSVIEMQNVSEEYIARALVNRGIKQGQRGNAQEAIADLTRAISLTISSVEKLAIAYCERASQRYQIHDITGAIEDYSAVIPLTDAPTRHIARALIDRGRIYYSNGELSKAFDDYSAAMTISDNSAELTILAFFNRGLLQHKTGNDGGAFDDYTSAINVTGSSITSFIAQSLVNRGSISAVRSRFNDAISDFTAAIDLAVLQGPLLANAYYNRGLASTQSGHRCPTLPIIYGTPRPFSSNQVYETICNLIN